MVGRRGRITWTLVLAATSACSLLVDTGGLSGGPGDGGADAAVPPNAPPPDVPPGIDGSSPDGSIPRCDPCPAPTLLASSPKPTYVAVDATNVYFGDAKDHVVRLVPKTGGVVRTIASGTPNPWVVATDGTYVYWTDNNSPSVVGRTDIATGTASSIAANEPYPRGLALADGTVFWTNESANDAGPASIVTAQPDGGARTAIASGGVVGHPKDVAVDGAFVYWADSNGKISRCQRDGGGLVDQLGSDLTPWGLALAPPWLAYTTYSDAGNVGVIRIDTQEKHILATNVPQARAVALDDAYVYWTVEGGHTVQRTTLAPGGKIVDVMTFPGAAFALALDGDYVYASTYDESDLSKSGVFRGPR